MAKHTFTKQQEQYGDLGSEDSDICGFFAHHIVGPHLGHTKNNMFHIQSNLTFIPKTKMDETPVFVKGQ